MRVTPILSRSASIHCFNQKFFLHRLLFERNLCHCSVLCTKIAELSWFHLGLILLNTKVLNTPHFPDPIGAGQFLEKHLYKKNENNSSKTEPQEKNISSKKCWKFSQSLWGRRLCPSLSPLVRSPVPLILRSLGVGSPACLRDRNTGEANGVILAQKFRRGRSLCFCIKLNGNPCGFIFRLYFLTLH